MVCTQLQGPFDIVWHEQCNSKEDKYVILHLIFSFVLFRARLHNTVLNRVFGIESSTLLGGVLADTSGSARQVLRTIVFLHSSKVMDHFLHGL